MSARTPFKFPENTTRAPSAAENVKFPPGAGNLLGVASKVQDEVKPGANGSSSMFRRPDGNGPPNGKKTGTAGLGRLAKRASADAESRQAPMEHSSITRPGTANPYSRSFQPQQQNVHLPLMAPTPQKPARISPSMGSSNPTTFSASSSSMIFKVPFGPDSNDSNVDKMAHISTLDNVSNGVSSDNSFRPASRSNGPQRVPVDQGPAMMNNSFMNNHKTNPQVGSRDDTFSPLQQASKRARDELEDEDEVYEHRNQAKRFKAHIEVNGQDSRKHTASPDSIGRPSSSMSRSVGPHGGTPAPHRRPDPYPQYQERLSNSPPEFNSGYGLGLSQPAALELGALGRLLKTDPDAYVKGRMDLYDEMAQRWTNCTMDEWKAGAEEIAAEYHKLLDHTKLYMDAKLKLYRDLHTGMEAHASVLEERKNTLDCSMKKVVHESGDVLK